MTCHCLACDGATATTPSPTSPCLTSRPTRSHDLRAWKPPACHPPSFLASRPPASPPYALLHTHALRPSHPPTPPARHNTPRHVLDTPCSHACSRDAQGVSALAFLGGGGVLVSCGEDTLAAAWVLSELLDVQLDTASTQFARPQPLHSWWVGGWVAGRWEGWWAGGAGARGVTCVRGGGCRRRRRGVVCSLSPRAEGVRGRAGGRQRGRQAGRLPAACGLASWRQCRCITVLPHSRPLRGLPSLDCTHCT